VKCPRCNTPVEEHPANLCLNLWLADEVMDSRLENYCATIGAAWEVVEQLKADGIGLIIWTFSDIVQAYRGKKDGDYLADEKAKVPLAICRAALKAVGANA